MPKHWTLGLGRKPLSDWLCGPKRDPCLAPPPPKNGWTKVDRVDRSSLSPKETFPRRLERTDEDQPRKLPRVEREARRAKLAERLTGLKLEGELEVSHALVDLCQQMRDDDAFKHVPLISCTKRDQEVLGKKKAENFKDYEADITTHHKLEKAFQRRALAFEMVEICTYEAQMAVVNRFMELLDEAPPDGHDRVTVKQILAADEAIALELAKRCRGGIKCAASGKMPLAENLQAVFEMQTVQLRLVPHKRAGGQQNVGAAGGDATKPPKVRGGRGRAKGQGKGSAAPPAAPPIRGGKKAGAKRAGGATLPGPMVGTCTAKTKEGVPLCFGYNTGRCNSVQPGQRCQRGLHGCAKLVNGDACGKAHPYTECTA